MAVTVNSAIFGVSGYTSHENMHMSAYYERVCRILFARMSVCECVLLASQSASVTAEQLLKLRAALRAASRAVNECSCRACGREAYVMDYFCCRS